MDSIEESGDASPKGKTPRGWMKFWQKEKSAAQKRTRQFNKRGNDVNRRFLDEDGYGDDDSFGGPGSKFRLNLFWKNVSTTQAMLYGNTPQIDVGREFHDPDDDVGRVAALLFTRMLETDVESSGEDLSTALKAALQDRLLPGLGVCRVRYAMKTTTTNEIDPVTGEAVETEVLDYEAAPTEYVHWQDFLWGWGRTWKEIPWIGFRVYLDKDEVTERFGEKVAKKLEYENQLPSSDENTSSYGANEEQNNIQKAEIWEFWSKTERKVFWYTDGSDLILDVKEDPLKLDGFWPMPRPMVANLTTRLFMPKADYCMAQDLYVEIDELQSRIRVITRAIKVIGVYDASATNSVGRMLKEGTENAMIPVDNWALFAEKGGIKGSIDWYPVQDVVGVLQVLKGVLADTMELLYEITGMSDIMRGGNTQQYTSDGTQQMKAKMGSIQIQALQDEFARFASDLEALKAEVISKHFAPGTIIQQSNAQFLPEADRDKIQPAVQLMQSPEVKWRVNIKPESIAMIDYAQLKSERSEFLVAMSTYIQSASGAAQSLPGALPVLLEMLKWGMAGFKGSDVLEGTMDRAIDMAKQQPPGGEGQDDGKQQAEQMKLQLEQLKQQGAQQKQQGEMQKLQMKAQLDMQAQQSKLQAEIAKIDADGKADLTLAQVTSQNRLREIAADLQSSISEIEASMDADLNIEQAQASFDIASQNVEHQHNMMEMKAATRNKIIELTESNAKRREGNSDGD